MCQVGGYFHTSMTLQKLYNAIFFFGEKYLYSTSLRSGLESANQRKLVEIGATSRLVEFWHHVFVYERIQISRLASSLAIEYPCVWEWLSPGGLPGLQHR